MPRRLGPKRASGIRKLFHLSKQDDVRAYVVKRPLAQKEGKKPRSKAPKVQRLITPLTLQVFIYLLVDSFLLCTDFSEDLAINNILYKIIQF